MKIASKFFEMSETEINRVLTLISVGETPPDEKFPYFGNKRLIEDAHQRFSEFREKSNAPEYFLVTGEVGWGKTALVEKLANDFKAESIIIKLPFFHEITKPEDIYKILARKFLDQVDFQASRIIDVIDNIVLQKARSETDYQEHRIETIANSIGVELDIATALYYLVFSPFLAKEQSEEDEDFWSKYDIAYRLLTGEKVSREEQNVLLKQSMPLGVLRKPFRYLPILSKLVTLLTSKPLVIVIDNLDIFYENLRSDRKARLLRTLVEALVRLPMFFIVAGSLRFWQDFENALIDLRHILNLTPETIQHFRQSIMPLDPTIAEDDLLELLKYVMSLFWIDIVQPTKDHLNTFENIPDIKIRSYVKHLKDIQIGHALNTWIECMEGAYHQVQERERANRISPSRQEELFFSGLKSLVESQVREIAESIKIVERVYSLSREFRSGTTEIRLCTSPELKMHWEILQTCFKGLHKSLQAQFREIIPKFVSLRGSVELPYYCTQKSVVVPVPNKDLRVSHILPILQDLEEKDKLVIIFQLVESSAPTQSALSALSADHLQRIRVFPIPEQEMITWYQYEEGIDSEISPSIKEIKRLNPFWIPQELTPYFPTESKTSLTHVEQERELTPILENESIISKELITKTELLDQIHSQIKKFDNPVLWKKVFVILVTTQQFLEFLVQMSEKLFETSNNPKRVIELLRLIVVTRLHDEYRIFSEITRNKPVKMRVCGIELENQSNPEEILQKILEDEVVSLNSRFAQFIPKSEEQIDADQFLHAIREIEDLTFLGSAAKSKAILNIIAHYLINDQYILLIGEQGVRKVPTEDFPSDVIWLLDLIGGAEK